jgi:hypothetical protein
VVVPHQVRLGGAQAAQLAVLGLLQFLVGVAPQHHQDLIMGEAVVPPRLGGHDVAHLFLPLRCDEAVHVRRLGLTVDQRGSALLVPVDFG